MILTTLMVASLLNVSDPSGDAVGAGQLTVPKAAIFRELANFDVLNLSIADQSTFAFEISMASLENPWNLPLGFSLPIIEVYAAIDPVKRNEARNELLLGSGMTIRKSDTWNYAFRITGNAIEVYRVEDGLVKAIAEDAALNYTITDNRIYIETNIRVSGDVSVYAMSGSYDPFSSTGWRHVVTEGQPWLLSSTTQESPVLDVVVDDFAMQQRSIEAGILPEITAAARQPSWLWVVVAGLLTCLLALIARPRKIVNKVQGSAKASATGLVTNETLLEESVLEQSVLNQQAQNSSVNTVVGDKQSVYAEKTTVQQTSSSESEVSASKKNRPIQWTSWDEGDFVAEDTMIEYDRIATEESKARAPQPSPLNVEVLEDQNENLTDQTRIAENTEINIANAATRQFQENLLPEVDDESLLSNKKPPKGFTKRMKTFGLKEVQAEDMNTNLDQENLE